MPTWLPEGDTALASDEEHRSLQKWNSLLYDAVPTSLTFFPEGTEPKPSDDDRRSLIKINALVEGIGGVGPTFFPEGGTPLPSDDERRSILKIAALFGQPTESGDSAESALQLIVIAHAAGTGPDFYPEGGESLTSDSAQRSLIKIVALGGSGGVVGGTVPPPLVLQQQYLKSSDETWHLFDLMLDGGINTERVIQTPVASPGVQYRGYAVLLADDATKHRLALIYEGGIHTLWVTQETTSEAAVASIIVQSTDANPDGYAVTLVNEGGIYVLAIEQP